MKFTRYILPVVVGAMAAMMLIKVGEYFITAKYFPLHVDVNDKAALATAIASMPSAAFLALLANYAVASFLGGLIAAIVAGRQVMRPSIIVGVVLTLAGLFTVISIPHPMWFTIVNLLVYIPCASLGYLTVRKSPAQ